MRLVERIAGKVNHRIEDMIRRLLVNSLRGAAGYILGRIAVHEITAFLLHDMLFLLAHRAADKIRAAQRIAAQIPDDLHNLLLIDDAAVSRLQNRLQERRIIGHFTAAFLAGNVLRYKVHRAGTVQRDAGDDIFQTPGAQFLHETLHASGFKLEHTICVSCPQRRKNIRVLHLYPVDINRDGAGVFCGFCSGGSDRRLIRRIRAAGPADRRIRHADRVLDDAECPKTQKVHF